MKKIFQNRGFLSLLIAIAILAIAIVYTAALGTGGRTSAGSSIVGMVTTPMQWIATKAGNRLSDLFTGTNRETVTALQQEVAELKEQLAAQNDQLMDYYELTEENERMRTALRIQEEYPDWTVVGATVVARDPNDLFGGFTVNKGSYSGVKVGDCVVTSDGLVGIVSRVSSVYARVNTLFDPEVSVSCCDLQSGDYGILRGDKKYSDRNLLCLKDLDAKSEVAVTHLVMTSGLGGTYPRGIVVGYVSLIEDNNRDVSLSALLRPAVNLDALENVVIVTDFPGRGEFAEALNNEE